MSLGLVVARLPCSVRVVRQSFVAYGTRFDISASSGRLLAALTRALPPGSKPSRSTRRPAMDVFVRGRGRCLCGHFHAATTVFESGVETIHGRSAEVVGLAARSIKALVTERSRHYVFLHAGVVAWQGRAILLPGFSLAGKTTLVHALVKAGARYYSDEFAQIDRRGRVVPYAQPLGIRQSPGLPQRPRALRGLGIRPATGRADVAAVFFLRFRSGGAMRVKRLRPSRALFALLPHAVNMKRRPAATLDRLSRAISQASLFDGVRGDATAAAAQILSIVGGAAVSPRARSSLDKDSKRLRL